MSSSSSSPVASCPICRASIVPFVADMCHVPKEAQPANGLEAFKVVRPRQVKLSFLLPSNFNCCLPAPDDSSPQAPGLSPCRRIRHALKEKSIENCHKAIWNSSAMDLMNTTLTVTFYVDRNIHTHLCRVACDLYGELVRVFGSEVAIVPNPVEA